MMGLVRLLTGFDGRVSRLGFWVGALLTGAITSALTLLLDRLGPAASAAVLVAMCWPLSAIFSKRLHDRGRRAASWTPLLLGPNVARRLWDLAGGSPPGCSAAGVLSAVLIAAAAMASLWVLVDLGFMPGSAAANRFGPPPGRLQN